MKTYILSFVFTFLISGFLFADGDTDKKKEETKFPNNLKKHLYSKVDYPDNARENKVEGYVAVLFEVSETGKLVITESSTNDNSLMQHVKSELENIQLCPFDLSVGNTYSITFYFDLM